MIRPSIGARLVCTSKIDKKIPTRRIFVFKISLASTSEMSITVPSAAATMAFRSAGIFRSGSRKKKSVYKIRTRKNSDNQPLKNQLPSVRKNKIARIQRASARVWRRIESAHFRSAKESGQGGKKVRQ